MRGGKKAPLYLTKAAFEKTQLMASLNSPDLTPQESRTAIPVCYPPRRMLGIVELDHGVAVDMSHAMAMPLA